MGRDKAVLLFSGGFDSVVLLHEMYYNQDIDITLLFFSYGQANEELELQKCHYWGDYFNVPVEVLVLNNFDWTKSSLYGNNRSSSFDRKDMNSQYIEMRNLIFFSYALSYAQSVNAQYIYSALIDGLGENPYPDSTIGFSKMFDTLSSMTTGVETFCPFIFAVKRQLAQRMVNIGLDLKHIINNSISCNTPVDRKPCGDCADCEALKDIENEFLTT